MKVSDFSVVTIRYTLSNKDGVVIDQSDDQNLLTYMHGTEYLVPGLENAITGHEKGDKFDVEVKAEDGYGEYRDNLLTSLSLDMFGDNPVNVGDTFIAQTEEGQLPVTVREMRDNEVIVDGNHPLAGVDLFFKVEIVDVREPTESEKEHGHVHVDGHCENEEHRCCHHHDHEEHEHRCCHHHDHEEHEHRCCHHHEHEEHEEHEHRCCHHDSE
jgi:FKBP-type peptidyl-prolyl cis-trans isomerase SlyD